MSKDKKPKENGTPPLPSAPAGATPELMEKLARLEQENADLREKTRIWEPYVTQHEARQAELARQRTTLDRQRADVKRLEDEFVEEGRRRADDELQKLRAREDESLRKKHAEFERECSSRRDQLEAEVRAKNDEAAKRLASARDEAQQLRIAALREADEIRARAATERKEAELKLEAQVLNTKASQERLDTESAAVTESRAALERRMRELEQREALLDAEAQQVRAQREELIRRESAFGTARVVELETRLAEERTASKVLSERIEAQAHEMARIRADFEALQGQGGARVRQDLEGARAEIGRLREQLAELPPRDEYARLEEELAVLRRREDEVRSLRIRNRELEDAQREHDAVVSDLKRHRELNQDLTVELEHLRLLRQQWEDAERASTRRRAHLEFLESELDRCRQDLERYEGASKARSETTWGALATLDSDRAYAAPTANRELKPVPALKDWIGTLQKRMAMQKPALKYREEDIAAFVAGLHASRLMILQGPSGTGKTSLVRAMGEELGAEVVRIPVQAGWRDKTDLVGYFNAFSRSFKTTDFTNALYRARHRSLSTRPMFVILDEVNLSRIEYYFADFLTMMDDPPNQWLLTLVDDPPAGVAPPQGLREHGGGKLPVPQNVWFFGTANEDESTFEVTDKVYDRSVVLQLDERPGRRPDKSGPTRATKAPDSFVLTLADWRRLVDICQLTDADTQALLQFDEAISQVLRDQLHMGTGNRFLDHVRRFLPVYSALGRQIGEGLDHFVATRLLRRVARLRDPGFRPAVEALRKGLDESWPKNWAAPGRSHVLLDRAIERLRRGHATT